MFIIINIKSKNKKSILRFLKIFKNLSKNKKLQLNRTLTFFQTIKTNKIFTILKSPHVNKTAQEQFEYNLFSIKFKITTLQLMKVLIILKKIEVTFLSDVMLNLKFIINTNNNNKRLINSFNPNTKIFEKINIYNLKSLELYLVSFNFYGKYKFIYNRLNSSVR